MFNIIQSNRAIFKVPTAQEKPENGQKNPCQGKLREFGNFAKTQGIWFAQVVNSLIPKVKIFLFLLRKFLKVSDLLLKVDKSARSQFSVCHKSHKLAQGNLWSDR